MDIFDQLDIIRSYGETKYWNNGDNKIMVIMHDRANALPPPVRGTGRDYDGAVDCLYTVLYHKMFDVVQELR